MSLVDPALASNSTADTTPAFGTPAASGGPQNFNGSQAALGVLMARVFHRSSGRAWRLRQRSHALWQEWLAELEGRGHQLPRRRGLLLLAAHTTELARLEAIAADRARVGIPMELVKPDALAALHPCLPGLPVGGLLSPEDGQLDPEPVLEALRLEALRAGATCVAEAAVAVERGLEPGHRWRLLLANGGVLQAHWLVLALGLGTTKLLAGLGHTLPLTPVLGQALELELAKDPQWSWPGVVVWRGMNLVPRPDLASGGRRLWLGATLEPGEQASAAALAELGLVGGEAPPWLRKAEVVRQWQGLRGRPVGQPAPVHAEIEPGLLIATGHYRNGVLLAPASAEWIGEQIVGQQR